uniref:Uncharacterized protein n=1 Tax=viral metagenome TaxID=1070528 RepID=A0A6C0EVH2_9ZZZZ
MRDMIFYDNDYRNILEVNKLFFIICVYIREEQLYLNFNKSFNYYKNFPNNSYCEYYNPKEISNPSNAFGLVQGNQLLEWLKDKKRPVVLFDWDKTITCCDGFIVDNYPFTYKSVNVLEEDVMEYLCGGYNRLDFIRYIFDCIKKKGDIIIVTNNDTAVKNKREFLKLIRIIDPDFKERGLIYGIKGNKRMALLKDNYFKTLMKYNV